MWWVVAGLVACIVIGAWLLWPEKDKRAVREFFKRIKTKKPKKGKKNKE